VRALALYSLAEFQTGHATTLRVRMDGRSFGVTDDGRGHAIERSIDGLAYLTFVYTHLDYPFKTSRGAAIQLHGIGTSLVNVLCSELVVTARKRHATLHMHFLNGRLHKQHVVEVDSDRTGNAIAGTIRKPLHFEDAGPESIRQWLRDVSLANPSLHLHFNDETLGPAAVDLEHKDRR